MALYDDPNVFYDADVFYDAEDVPKLKKHMARILRNWSRMNRQARVTAGQLVITKLTGNADVPTPNPSVATLTTAFDTAQQLIDDVAQMEQNLAALRTQRDNAIDSAVTQLGQEASTVEGATAGDEAKILGAGFEVVQAAAAVGVLPAPQDLRTSAGDDEGSLDNVCDAVDGAASYEWQTTPNPNDPASWTGRGTTTKSSAHLTGLTSGTRLWSRVRAHGAAGPGAWSDAASKMVP